MNIKETLKNKAAGFYVGVAGCVLALVAMIVYCSMGSAYFTGWVVAGLVVGIVLFLVSALFKFNIGIILSYVCYMFAMYQFMIPEINQRLDIFVTEGMGPAAVDAIFWVASVFIVASIIATIVSSCMKQDKAAA